MRTRASSPSPRRIVAAFAGALLASLLGGPAARAAAPQTVYFPSADGTTELVGYLYAPQDGSASGTKHPAVVMLHGRAGPYSSNVHAGCTTVARGVESPCGAETLTMRHRQWGEYWARHGYAALLVDSFGPRGRGHGYARFTHDDPQREAVNERTVRPLDAEGALAWLAARPDIAAERVMLQGWSNGGSTVLNVLHRQAGAAPGVPRFRAAFALYPGCGPKALLARSPKVDVPLLMLLAADDEEVSPTICREVANRAGAAPDALWQVQWYEGATHDFDDPGKTRQSVPGNRAAQADALQRAAPFFDGVR